MKRLLLVLIVVIATGCSSVSFTLSSMNLYSSVFDHQGSIPAKYTCDGVNVSPPLAWSHVPEGTKSFVLIVDDSDAIPVAGFVWDHWILFNIPADVREIGEGLTVGMDGKNSFGHLGYGGPCPPNGVHSYSFRLYALDTSLDLSEGVDKVTVESSMKNHIIERAELVGRYDRI